MEQQKYQKSDLLVMLKGKEFEMPPGTHINKVKEKCAEMNIPLKTPEREKIEQGWMGKPKGMLQVLWERGLIDETRLKDYMISGKKDAYGTIDLTFSLKHLLSQCRDFAEEESLLQSMGIKMGVLINRTPKCHAELVGEEIEYT